MHSVVFTLIGKSLYFLLRYIRTRFRMAQKVLELLETLVWLTQVTDAGELLIRQPPPFSKKHREALIL